MMRSGYVMVRLDRKKTTRYFRRSAIIVWTAVTLVAMIGFVALAVDVGYTYHTKDQLQRTADAAAMAAASKLAISENPSQTALELATTYTQKNQAGGMTLALSPNDIVLGRAVEGDNGKYVFEEDSSPFDAVKVTVRLTNDSPNGSLGLFFGGALGVSKVDVSASAIAMLVPRDIAVIIDLSNSMSYDSQLRYEYRTDINIADVWHDLGSPTYGKMTTFHNSYSEMPYWRYKSTNQVLKDLGLNGVPYPYPGGSWYDYVNYVKYSITYNYRYRYGLRTWVNYLMDREPGEYQTPVLSECRVQPVYAVKQAVEELCNYLTLLQANDFVALCSYSGDAYFGGPDARIDQQLTGCYSDVTQAAYARQAGEYGRYTNIYAGIEEGISELLSDRARPGAKKVIFLMTDGNPNRPSGDGTGYAIQAAEHAISEGIQIYTISLGSGANQTLMSDIAEIGKGVHYHVPTLDISQCEEDLKNVFRTLGGKRPVRLIK